MSKVLSNGMKITSRSTADVVFGSMLSTDIVPIRQSELDNDDYTVKDEDYESRVFASAEEKTQIIDKVGGFDLKTYWVGEMAAFTDPSAWQTELTAFVTAKEGRAPKEKDQVTVSDSHAVYQFRSDGEWFQFATNSSGLSFQSELTNDDFTVKDEHYSERVFTGDAEKTAAMNHIDALEKKTYFVGSMTNFTDPSAYEAELTAFVTATISRAAQEGDQVAVTDLKRVYQVDSSGQWFVFANSAENLTKQSELINDDNTVKDADYEDRVFATGIEKATTLAQVNANKDDIVDLKAEDVALQNQIDRLQKKTFWVGSIANFVDPSAYQTELTDFVQTKLSRAPQEGDQVSVSDIRKVYQYSNGGDWQVFSSTLLIDTASKVNSGVVKIGEGIDVDSDGVISVSDEATGLNMKVLTTVTLETWAEDDANVSAGRCVSLYASVATDGIAAPAIYRVYKKDADNILIDCFVVGTGRCYHKIKCDGTWSPMAATSSGGAVWGAIDGTLSDQTDLSLLLDQKVGTDKIVNNLTSEDSSSVLSGAQGCALFTSKISTNQIADNLTTNDSTKVLSAKQGKVLNDSKIATTQIADNLTTTDTTKVLSAKQGKILNDKLSNGGVTKLGTATVGGYRQPIYLNAGKPVAFDAHGSTPFNWNGTKFNVATYGSVTGTFTWYGAETAGVREQILWSSGSGAPVWGVPKGLGYGSASYSLVPLESDALPYTKTGCYKLKNVFDYTLIVLGFYRKSSGVEYYEERMINPAIYRTTGSTWNLVYLYDTNKSHDNYCSIWFRDLTTYTEMYIRSIKEVQLRGIWGFSPSATFYALYIPS